MDKKERKNYVNDVADILHYGTAIEEQIRQSNFATAEYLIENAPKGLPKQAYYATMALIMSAKMSDRTEKRYAHPDERQNMPVNKQTLELANMLLDYCIKKAGTEYFKQKPKKQ